MRRLLMTVPAIAAAVLAGACKAPAAAPEPGSASAPSSQAPSSQPSASHAPASQPSASHAPARSSGGAGRSAAACRTGGMSAVVTWQPDRDGGRTHMGLVTLTNKSKSSCTVDGWAAISLVNAADEVVPVRTTRVDQPGRPVRTTLRPGTSAFAGIKWTACDKGDSACGAGNTLRFNLEASTDGDVARLEGFPDPAASNITMKSLQIGSLQPSRQGVVAW